MNATGGPRAPDPVAKDVFIGADDEKNLLIFRRDGDGHVSELIERRKCNDLHLARAGEVSDRFSPTAADS